MKMNVHDNRWRVAVGINRLTEDMGEKEKHTKMKKGVKKPKVGNMKDVKICIVSKHRPKRGANL